MTRTATVRDTVRIQSPAPVVDGGGNVLWWWAALCVSSLVGFFWKHKKA